MLQGVINASRKRHLCDTPNFLQGSYDVRSNAMQGTPRILQRATVRAQQCRELSTLKGAMHNPQKCHFDSAPNFLQRVIRGAQKCHILFTLKGSMSRSQKCHIRIDPTIFIWCRNHLAEMPLLKRTKGRVMDWPQKCHTKYTLPNQLQGTLT
jgi:hypothetical protein